MNRALIHAALYARSTTASIMQGFEQYRAGTLASYRCIARGRA